MKKILSLLLVCEILLVSLVGCAEKPMPKEMPEDFSFSLSWGVYGISSYDSRTGKLVKTKDATNPEDYVTYLKLPDEALEFIYEDLRRLDVESYPDEYDPDPMMGSNPSADLILTVRMGDYVKTIAAKDVSLSYQSLSLKGQRFIDTCLSIRDILTATDEWQALPDYEFYYD
jgi:hypothetical protein